MSVKWGTTLMTPFRSYAVFPERLDVMSQSNLMKVVGRIGGEVVTIEGRLRDSGWALIMPDQPEVVPGGPAVSPLNNMMRWVTGGWSND
jgi:CCR4-NOT transcriptional complex subunit CAF120